MPDSYRAVLRFLYVLLFFSFVGLSLGQPVGSWIAATYGGWITLEAATAYGLFILGLIWLIDRIAKASAVAAPASTSSYHAMTEMEIIRSHMKAAETWEAEVPPEIAGRPDDGDKS